MTKFENIAFSICCVPCSLKNGYYIPVHNPILTDILGKVSPHPIFNLKKYIDPELFKERNINQVIILLDDLDVMRNWILPVKYTTRQLDDEIKKFIITFGTKLKNNTVVSINIYTLSKFLRENKLKDFFDSLFCKNYRLIKRIVEQKQDSRLWDKEINKIIATNIGRRKSFYKKVRGYSTQQLNNASMRVIILEQSVNHLANYMAQGQMMTRIRVGGYLLTDNSEPYLMSIYNLGFSKLVLNKNES